MRVGICAFWFNRGQGVVARQLRSALDELGHETFVLGRPTKEAFPMPQEAREDDVWAQEGVTSASNFFIPEDGVPAAGRRTTGIEACFFDQNYQFDELDGAARGRRPDDRALRLGAVQRRARRAGAARPTTSSTR